MGKYNLLRASPEEYDYIKIQWYKSSAVQIFGLVALPNYPVKSKQMKIDPKMSIQDMSVYVNKSDVKVIVKATRKVRHLVDIRCLLFLRPFMTILSGGVTEKEGDNRRSKMMIQAEQKSLLPVSRKPQYKD